MNKLIRLLSVQLWAVLGDMLSLGKSNSNKKKPAVLYAGILFFTVVLSVVSFIYSFMIGAGLKMFNSLDILPALMMAVACAVILMTTIFKVKGTIFGFRDYDMVMSLPVSTGTIVACRLIILYSFNFLFVIILTVPMMIAYGILANPNPVFYFICLLVMFFIPLVPIIIASVLGTVIAYAASKFRHNNLLNIILSLGLLAVVVGLSFTVNGNGKQFVDIGKAITNQVGSIYPLAQMYTEAVVHYDIVALLLFISISIAAFLLYTLVVEAIFKKMNTLMLTGRAGVKFKMKELKTSSPIAALYVKELKRYFSSSLYVLNTGLGIVMLTVAAIAAIFVDLDKVLGDPMVTYMFKNNIPLVITFCVIMTYTAASSISLEGKNLWIIKSMPIPAKTVYLSKLAVNLTILAPAVIDTVIIGAAMRMGVIKTMILVLVTITCSLFTALFGLLMNILLPNFNWTTEVVIIKQSAASMISIFGAMAYVGVQFAFLYLIPGFLWANLGYFLLTLVIDIVLYMLIMTYGKKRYLAF
ncbi:MAG TPA: hypothetical protein VN258_03770 [Mobilitalea sp.]|nr:hypothetical protein [Mobilitalea sp.]